MRKILLILLTVPVLASPSGEPVSKALEVWSIMSFFELSLLLLFLGLVFHFASLYYARTLSSFMIRLSGENWGIIFVLVRDISLFAAFGIGALLINPDTFGDVKLALPFVPLGTIILGIALVIKLSRGLETDWAARKLFTWLLAIAAFLQYFGFIFIMEAAPAEWVSSGKAGTFWLTLRSFRSNLNPSLSMWTFYLCFPLLIIVLIFMLLIGLSKRKWEEKVEIEKRK